MVTPGHFAGNFEVAVSVFLPRGYLTYYYDEEDVQWRHEWACTYVLVLPTQVRCFSLLPVYPFVE